MRLESLVFASSLLGIASAHFHLQFPEPRGPFVADDEVTFCDNYLTAVPNRTEFPLHGGFISFSSGHPHWTFGVILSTAENSTNFANFTQAVDFFSGDLPGNICFPVDFGNTNISGLHDGANVTVQMVFDAGDGKLYQCADLTLRDNVQIPSNITCANTTATSAAPSSPSETAPAPTQSNDGTQSVARIMTAMSVVAAIWAVLL